MWGRTEGPGGVGHMRAGLGESIYRRIETLFRAGTLGGAGDGELLERFVRGGRSADAGDAFAALVERHGPMVVQVCRRVLDDPHEAEDAAQAAFLVLARRARSVRRGEAVGSWLFGVALRVSRRARARAAARRAVERRGAELMAARAREAAGPDEPRWGELYAELDRLPRSLREPLVLCYLQGLTHEQAAAQLGLSPRTLRRRLADGRERLRERLERRGFGTTALIAGGSVPESLAPAPIPAAWVDQTVTAALAFASGGGTGPAALLAQEVIRIMYRKTIGLVAAALLAVGAVGLGVGPLALGQKEAPAARAGDATPSPPIGGPELPDFLTARPRTGPGRITRIRVTEAATGRPVPQAGAIVGKGFDRYRTAADAEGWITIEHSTGPADTFFSVDVWGDGLAMQRHSYGRNSGEPIPDEATIALQPGETLGGLVQDEQGHPVEGATVYLLSRNFKRRDPAERLTNVQATTGPDGRWRTGSAPQTTGELEGFDIRHPDYVNGRGYHLVTDVLGNDLGEKKPSIEQLRAGTAVSTVSKGPYIEGRVLDAEGRPVPGAVVLSTDFPSRPIHNLLDDAVVSDAEGRFRTGQVKPGEWHLIARVPGHAPGAAVVNVERAIPHLEITLGRPRPLRVRVWDESERPVSGALVSVDTWKPEKYRGLGVYLWTDSEGRAVWADAPDDGLGVSVQRDGFLAQYRVVSPANGEDLVFRLMRGLSISGPVRDSATGAEVGRGEVEYGSVDPATGEVDAWERFPGGTNQVSRGQLRVSLPVKAAGSRLRITAPGYAPFVSRIFGSDEGEVTGYTVVLSSPNPDTPRARVTQPDGTPLAGARIAIGRLNERNVWIQNGAFGGLPRRNTRDPASEFRTDADGSFPIPPLDSRSLIVVLGDQGYAYATKADLDASPHLQARPFARIEGRYRVGGHPQAGAPLELDGALQDEETAYVSLTVKSRAITDAEGRFAFEKVIPFDNLRLARRDPPEKTSGRLFSLGVAVRVAPGETARVDYGGDGRPVVGRVAPPLDWTEPVDFTKESGVKVQSNRPRTPYPPALFRGKTAQERSQLVSTWARDWMRTAEGRAMSDAFQQFDLLGLEPDGSFRFDEVPPGDYRVEIRVAAGRWPGPSGPFGRLAREFTIPPIPGGRTDEPFDLGELRLERRGVPVAGQPAPDIEVTTIEGRTLSLPGDFKGRYLLLDFGTLWEDQSRYQIGRMHDLHSQFAGDERVVFLSLLMARDDAESRRFVEEKAQPWPQAIVEPLSNPVASAYGYEDDYSPRLVLVGPDGTVLVRDYYGEEVRKRLAEALGR